MTLDLVTPFQQTGPRKALDTWIGRQPRVLVWFTESIPSLLINHEHPSRDDSGKMAPNDDRVASGSRRTSADVEKGSWGDVRCTKNSTLPSRALWLAQKKWGWGGNGSKDPEDTALGGMGLLGNSGFFFFLFLHARSNVRMGYMRQNTWSFLSGFSR